MIKMIVFAAIAAVIEVIRMTAFNKSDAGGKADPDAVTVTAYRDEPFPDVYDEKEGRSVSSYRYVWEYRGKKRSITLCNSRGNHWEHCISDLAGRPDFVPEISITVNRNTGRYYVPENVRARKRNYLLSLVISLAAGWFITNMIF